MTRKTYRLTHQDGTPVGTFYATDDELRHLCERGNYCATPETTVELNQRPSEERQASHKQWALSWFNGHAYCPHCQASGKLRSSSRDIQGDSTITSWECGVCDGRFRTESRDCAALVEYDNVECYEPADWIERDDVSP